MIVFIVSGLWHGAGWNFIFWGFLHGSFQIIEKLLTPIFQTKIHNMKTYGTFGFKTAQTLFTFCLVNFAWIFFRSESLEHAFTFIRGIFRLIQVYCSMPICLRSGWIEPI
jgi:D-alanyl-lipoteichoic acid acyltransferase DltB (MBOAT superfamily)